MLVFLCVALSTFGQANEVAPAARSLTEIRKEISAQLKAESTATNEADRQAAVLALVAVHREITSHPQFTTNEFLQQQRIKVWSRLLSVRDELQRRAARERRLQRDDAKSDRSQLVARQLQQHYELSGQIVPTALPSAFGGGAYDNGQLLIELIQTTINPASWDVNGGNASIFYYPPVMALVVRASSEVHGELGAGLEGLRAAGR